MARYYNGFVTSHRSIDNPDQQANIFAGRPFERDIFLWIIRNANYRASKTEIKRQGGILQRGQIATSIREIELMSGHSNRVVRRVLGWLEANNQITRKATHLGTIISVSDYSKFQESKEKSDSLPYQLPYQPPNDIMNNKTIKQINNLLTQTLIDELHSIGIFWESQHDAWASKQGFGIVLLTGWLENFRDDVRSRAIGRGVDSLIALFLSEINKNGEYQPLRPRNVIMADRSPKPEPSGPKSFGGLIAFGSDEN